MCVVLQFKKKVIKDDSVKCEMCQAVVRQSRERQSRESLLGRGPILHEGLREGFPGRVTFNQVLKVGVDKANT